MQRIPIELGCRLEFVLCLALRKAAKLKMHMSAYGAGNPDIRVANVAKGGGATTDGELRTKQVTGPNIVFSPLTSSRSHT